MNETISTRSLWCSAYLLLQGHQLMAFELLTQHNGHFLFKKDKQIEKDIADYYASSPEVPIRDYLANFNALRDLVMCTKREARLNQGGRYDE
jgi:hypothetical protein